MNVERDIAGFALPFVAGVLVTAYAESLFCGDFSLSHFSVLLIIFVAVFFLLRRTELYLGTYMLRVLVGIAALGCGVLSAATSMAIIDMTMSDFSAFCRDIGTGLQTRIDSIPFRSEDTSALIKALLTGERNGLSSEIKSAFRDSGASHILALSGLHLGIIYGILSKSLSVFGGSRTMRTVSSVLVISICGIYTLATGAGDSLVRALIFITLREVARLTGRYHGLGQILLASLVIQLVIDPLAIRSVSFQLSYAAMAGIAFVCPWLQGFWERAAGLFKADEGAASGDGEVTGVGDGLVSSWGTSVRNFATLVNRTGTLLSRSVRWIWNTVALSIACQITTAPLAYMYFGTFPVHFMLTNLLSLPLTGLLIPSALLTVGLSALGCCPPVLIKVTEWLVCALIWLLNVISSM